MKHKLRELWCGQYCLVSPAGASLRRTCLLAIVFAASVIFSTAAQAGSLTVTIKPAAARTAGAQWRVDGGRYRNSGKTVNLPAGLHTVSYKAVTSWLTPASQIVAIRDTSNTSITGTYVLSASLKVSLQPNAAVTSGAQWQVDGGAYNASGYTQTGLTAGNHTVSFRSIPGWKSPANQIVTLSAGKTTAITYTYLAETTSLTVTIQPAGAVTAGAQWQVDGGAYHPSGYTQAGMLPGTHNVSFSVVAGWIKPVSQSVMLVSGQPGAPTGIYTQQLSSNNIVVFSYNDLGMHCMNEDFSELMILPPYNVLHAQVIDRSHGSPEIVREGITVSYRLTSNTTSSNKTNFWDFADSLFGVTLPPNIGLTGNGMSGNMVYDRTNTRSDWGVTGIPITPVDDDGTENAYPLAVITVSQDGRAVAQTQAVVPVSWEISCNICHNARGVTPGTDILQAHDRLHGTNLVSQKPVACGSCHAQSALAWPGTAGVPSLSQAMNGAHAARMAQANLDVDCYACHPGVKTQCQRDIHFMKGITCVDCHGTMEDVADPSRLPWQTEPSCRECHQAMRPGFQFEPAGTLFRDAKGHQGVMCSACHGSPHAITPSIRIEDNIQAITIQGHAGTIDTCSVCHSEVPSDPFPHRRGD